MKLFFDTKKLSQKEIVREIDATDKRTGAEHTTAWNGEVMEVDWPAANLAKIDQITQTVTETKPDGSTKTTTTTRPSMSITGLQSGAFKSLLAQMKQEIAAAQTQGLADVQAAKDSAANEIKTTIAGVKAKIQSEVSDALQEFSEFTNGGPA